MIPYLILRVTGFDSASGPIPGNASHWLDIVEEYFLLSRPAIGLLLQTKPGAEKEAGGTFLGCFIGTSSGGVAMLARGAHLLGDDGRKGVGGADVGRPSGIGWGLGLG